MAAAGLPPAVQVFTNDWLVGDYGDPRSQRVVLPNAVPVQSASRDPGPAVPGGERRAIFLGRFSPEKGLPDLIAAWPSEALATSWRLELYGEDRLDMRLPDGVKVCGHTSDRQGVVSDAGLVVIPSRREAGPDGALEAASVAVSFVGTRVGHMTEMVEQSSCGWLADPRDPASLGSALQAALHTAATDMREVGARGATWLREHRPFDDWCRRLRELYAS